MASISVGTVVDHHQHQLLNSSISSSDSSGVTQQPVIVNSLSLTAGPIRVSIQDPVQQAYTGPKNRPFVQTIQKKIKNSLLGDVLQ